MPRALLLRALLLGAFWVWGLPGRAGGCVLCDPAAGAALGELLGPFLERAMPAEPAARGRLGTLVLRGVLGLARLPRDPRSFMGVIDQPTLEEASTNFRRTLSRVMAQDLRDQQIYQELLWAMREIKEDFERLMKRFQSQVYCPNKCGKWGRGSLGGGFWGCGFPRATPKLPELAPKRRRADGGAVDRVHLLQPHALRLQPRRGLRRAAAVGGGGAGPGAGLCPALARRVARRQNLQLLPGTPPQITQNPPKSPPKSPRDPPKSPP
uniref:Uncharacterized protein n=1 Tax=Geospiza parvula TaxID=87175 RepID=A0A8U8BYT8_GEOPR